MELLKNGTVCFLDPGSTKFPDACLQAYTDAGIRVILGEGVTDLEAPFPLPRYTTEEAVARTAVVCPEMARAPGREAASVGHALLAGDLQRRPTPRPETGGRRAGNGLTLHHGSGPAGAQGLPGAPWALAHRVP